MPTPASRAEPGLAPARHKIAGGLRLPGDETGDCFKFTNRLATHGRRAGRDLPLGVTIDPRLEADIGHRITAVRHRRPGPADAFVVALGQLFADAGGPFGIRLPVYPVKGYSITVPIIDDSRAPVSTVMDETYKIAITRLGDRIRVGGMAEIAGFDFSLPAAAGHAGTFGRGSVRRRRRPVAGRASGPACAR
jgi:D-amino-acid dehydrogenase